MLQTSPRKANVMFRFLFCINTFFWFFFFLHLVSYTSWDQVVWMPLFLTNYWTQIASLVWILKFVLSITDTHSANGCLRIWMSSRKNLKCYKCTRASGACKNHAKAMNLLVKLWPDQTQITFNYSFLQVNTSHVWLQVNRRVPWQNFAHAWLKCLSTDDGNNNHIQMLKTNA